MTKASGQAELPLRPIPAHESYEVPLAAVLRQPTRGAVIALQAQASGMDDKQIARELGIDNGQWSRIIKGSAHFPTNLYHKFNVITGARYVLWWDIWQEGLDPESLRPLKSDIEQELEAEREKRRDLEKQLETLANFMRRGMMGDK